MSTMNYSMELCHLARGTCLDERYSEIEALTLLKILKI